MKKDLKLMMKNKGMFILIFIIFLLLTFGTFYLFYVVSLLNNIENNIRFLLNIILLFLWFMMFNMSINVLKKNKKKKYLLLLIFMFIYSIILVVASITAHNIYGKIAKISTSTTTYSSSIVTLNTNDVSNIKDIPSNEKIGILDDENSIDGYTVPNEIIKKEKLKNEIVKYSDYSSLIHDLLDEKIKYVFLPTNYEVKLSNTDSFDFSKTKIVYSYEKSIKLETNTETKITEPITVLLMGVDSSTNDIKNASLNGDALMLITFNPKTLNSTILSIPRDTYTSISCFAGNRKNKITHAAWYGESCMQKTIENLMDIKIDYYVKIDFKGVVNLVDAIGGIEVDVPIKFCEQDSNRNFDNLICLNKGKQVLNGEQALALSRHRKTINDFIRGKNQQLVVKGLMNKLLEIRDLNTVSSILDTISNNIETNMTTNQIFSFYDIALKIVDASKTKDAFNMQRLYISGYDQYIFDYSNLYNAGMKLNLYNFIPYDQSLDEVKKAMKSNLGYETEIIKNFDFDINTKYEEKVIGKGTYSVTNKLNLLPNFVGKDQSVAISYGRSNNIPVKVENVSGSNSQFVGQIISQTPYSNIDTEFMDKSKGITIKVVSSIPSSNIDNNTDNTNPEKNENDIIIDNEE